MDLELKFKRSGVGGETEQSTITMTVNSECTVSEMKERLVGRCDIPPEQQRLIYKGRVLQDQKQIEFYGLSSGDTILLLRSHAQQQQEQQQQQQQQSLPGNVPGFGGMDNELMRQMMDSPMVQSMLNNPEFLRSMFESNPQMRALLEANPHLNHVLNDPQLLRQSLEAARNPAMMQEMMRNQDRAMSNIESLPGGYNALRRMYEDVQRPMMEAAESAASSRQQTASSPPADSQSRTASSTPNDAPLPNPWDNSAPQSRPEANATQSPSNSTSAANPFDFMNMLGGSTGPTSSRQQNPWSVSGNSSTAPPSTNPWGALGNSTSSSTTPSSTNPWASATRASGGTPTATDPREAMIRLLESPGFREMMTDALSDPNSLQAIEASNPMFAAMLSSNPSLRHNLTDPSFVSRMLDPSHMRAVNNRLAQIQQQTGTSPFPAPGLFPPPPTSMLGAMNPETLYSRQLEQLQEMGFTNRQDNIRALQAAQGSVEGAIDRLSSGDLPPPPSTPSPPTTTNNNNSNNPWAKSNPDSSSNH